MFAISLNAICTRISFIDSTFIAVCHNRRIRLHKVLRGIAQRDKSSTGWLYEFKLHIRLLINLGIFAYTLIVLKLSEAMIAAFIEQPDE